MENHTVPQQLRTKVELNASQLPALNLSSKRTKLSRYYTPEERCFLVEIVESRQLTRVVPFAQVVPDWEAIALALERFSGRKASAAQLKNYYHGELKDKATIQREREKREKTRQERQQERIALRIANRAKLSEATARDPVITFPSTVPSDQAEAGAIGASGRGYRLFTRDEENLLLELVHSCRVKSGANKGKIDWDAIVPLMDRSFPPRRDKGIYQGRLRRILAISLRGSGLLPEQSE